MPFSENPKGSIDRFKTRVELYDKYKDNGETSLDGSIKLYDVVRKISSKDFSSVTIKDHAQNNLNLAVSTKNRVIKMRLNLANILVQDMIHFHKKTR